MKLKICARCKTEIRPKDLVPDKTQKTGSRSYCRPCFRIKTKKQYDKDKSKRVNSTLKSRNKKRKYYDQYQKEYRRKLKTAVINGYGGKCTCCGETIYEFLTVEHVNRDGHIHRSKKDSLGIYREIINTDFPDNYTILCMNCNFAKRWGRQCPHENLFSEIEGQ